MSELIETPYAAQVWSALKALLEPETDPPLRIDNFVLQKDAFIRLSDEDVESDAPFVSYNLLQNDSDTALELSLHLYNYYFEFTIGPTEYTSYYQSFAYGVNELQVEDVSDMLDAAKPKAVARNILLTIKLILSGQIAVGCSFSQGTFVAAETYLLGYGAGPLAINLIGNFSLRRRQATDFLLKQNRLLDEKFEIPPNFPLLPPVVNGMQVQRGRSIDSLDELEPLNKKKFTELETAIALHEYNGKDPNQNIWEFFYKTVDFWLVSAAFIIAITAIHTFEFIPNWMTSTYLNPVYLWISILGVSFITSVLLTLRQAKIEAGANPVTYRIEKRLAGFGFSRVYNMFIQVGLFISVAFTPLWAIKDVTSPQLSTGVQLINQVLALYVLLGFNVIAIIYVAFAKQTKVQKVVSALFAICAAVGPFIVNAFYMDTTGKLSPEPADLYFLPLIILGMTAIIGAIVQLSSAYKKANPLNEQLNNH